MKTKELIKQAGLKLFNEQGVMSVTLRDVAKKLNKSYGNITYHFPKKEDLILALYFEMVNELLEVSSKIFKKPPSLQQLLEAPTNTFDVSFKYVFLLKDYVALIRNYPTIANAAKESNTQRKKNFLQYLLILQSDGLLHNALSEEDLNYLMDLSGAMRTFFFLQAEYEVYDVQKQKEIYIQYVNRLLFPYLTEKGQIIYREFE